MANFITGVDLNPVATELGVEAQAFLPTFAKHEWLNWFGIVFDYQRIKQFNLTLVKAKSDITQSTTMSGSALEVGLAIRPTLKNRVVSRVGLQLFPYISRTEQMKIAAAGKDPGENLTVLKKIWGLSTEVESNPFGNFLVQWTFDMRLSQSFSVKDSISSFTANGIWQQIGSGLNLGMRFPFWFGRNRPVFEGLGGITWRQETITSVGLLGTSAKKGYSALGYRIKIGLGFAH